MNHDNSSIRADADDRGCSDPAALLKLAERCEREEPSWALSVDIELALVAGAIDRRSWDPQVAVGRGDKAYNPPAYVTSLDAAVTLVPKGWEWSYSNRARRGFVLIELWHNAPPSAFPSAYSEQAKTFAQGLCAAALRARAYEASVAGKDRAQSAAPQS